MVDGQVQHATNWICRVTLYTSIDRYTFDVVSEVVLEHVIVSPVWLMENHSSGLPFLYNHFLHSPIQMSALI